MASQQKKLPFEFPALVVHQDVFPREMNKVYRELLQLVEGIRNYFLRTATAVNTNIAISGTTGQRPTTDLAPGQPYFDTTLGKPIWRNAANNGWVDATGAAV